MKTISLIVVGLLSWAAGIWHVQVLAQAVAAAETQQSVVTASNWPYLLYTAMLFVMPVVGWGLRNRAPFWAAFLIAAFPLLLMAATIRVKVS